MAGAGVGTSAGGRGRCGRWWCRWCWRRVWWRSRRQRPTPLTAPQVDSTTRAVTPAPTPGVDWSGCDLPGANLSRAKPEGREPGRRENLAGANLSFAFMIDAMALGLNGIASATEDPGVGVKAPSWKARPHKRVRSAIHLSAMSDRPVSA